MEFDLKIQSTINSANNIMIEIVGTPFPTGFTYTNEFKKHLMKINGQTTWAPYEITPNNQINIKIDCMKDKIYYMRFYEANKTYGGEITYLMNCINSK